MPTYYTINEATARTAKHMMSFDEYKEGSATSEYRSMVDKATEIAERQKRRVDPMYHEKIDHLLDLYARKLAENMNQHVSFILHSICASYCTLSFLGVQFRIVRKGLKSTGQEVWPSCPVFLVVLGWCCIIWLMKFPMVSAA